MLALLPTMHARPASKAPCSQMVTARLALQARLRKAEAGRGAGGVAAAGEVALKEQAAEQSARLRTTRERIARDKAVAAAGLQSVEHVPRGVLVEVVQDACVAVDVGDATDLPAAVARLLRAAAALPRMEAFVDGVCEAVFSAGAALLPGDLTERDPAAVLPV